MPRTPADIQRMPQFMTIGSSYHVGPLCQPFAGPVIVGPDHLFLCVKVDQKEIAAAMYPRGSGPLGIVSKGIAHVPTPGLSELESDLGSLPESITMHADWPEDSREGRVFIAPREEIDHLRYGTVSGLMFRARGLRFGVQVDWKTRRECIAFMKSLGWNVDDRTIIERVTGLFKRAG